ncbi:MAG: DUF4870 domain-containing protein [Microbacteriaceae bacterium]
MSDSTPGSGAPQPAAPSAPLSPADDVLWGSLAHLGGILGILPSLIIWLVLRGRGAFTDTEGKEALNFQLTLLGAEIIGYILFVALIGFIIVPAVYVLRIVFSILAFVKAKDGVSYRYPFAVRLVK